MDPQTSSDGKPYGPIRFKQLVQERYLITKHTHTSYGDTGKITPTEKNLLLEFINDDLKKEHDAIEEAKVKAEQQRKGRSRRR